MKKITEKRQLLLDRLDKEYDDIRSRLANGYSAPQFNKRGQRTQSFFLGQFKVLAEQLQDLNRIQAFLKEKVR